MQSLFLWGGQFRSFEIGQKGLFFKGLINKKGAVYALPISAR
jgi:hypothetical protein